MMHLELSFDLGDGAGTCSVQVEDLEPSRLSDEGRSLLRRLLGVCIEHHLALAEQGGGVGHG